MMKSIRPALLFAFAAVLSHTAFANDVDVRRITPQQEALATVPVPASDLDVGVWVDRPDGLYLPEDRVTVYVRVNQPAYVSILNVDATGVTTRMIPNAWETSTLIPAAGVRAFPGGNAGYSFKVSQPFGSNLIKVVASSKPFNLGATKSAGFLTDEAASFVRHIQAVQVAPSTKWASAQITIGVVPQRNAVPTIGQVQPAMPVPPPPPGAMPPPPPPPPAVAQTPMNGTPLDNLPSAFGLHLSTDRSSYRTGEAIRLELSAERDCTVAIAAVYPDGRLSRLYPNAVDKEVTLHKGATTFLPVSNSKSGSIVADGPAGYHAFVAVCAEQKSFLDTILGRSASDTDNRAAFAANGSTPLESFLERNNEHLARRTATYAVTP